MRDKSHKEQVERWARYVKENPGKWKKELKPFIDGQLIKAQKVFNKLSKTPEGKKKIRQLKNL